MPSSRPRESKLRASMLRLPSESDCDVWQAMGSIVECVSREAAAAGHPIVVQDRAGGLAPIAFVAELTALAQVGLGTPQGH